MKKILLSVLFLLLLVVAGGMFYYARHNENKLNQMRAERDALSTELAAVKEELAGSKSFIQDEQIPGALVLASILVEDSYEKVRKVKMVLSDFDYTSDRSAYDGVYWLLLLDGDDEVLDKLNLSEFKMFMNPFEDDSVQRPQKNLWSFDPAGRKVGLYYGPDASGVWATEGKSMLWVMFDNHFFPRPVFIESDKLVFYQ